MLLAASALVRPLREFRSQAGHDPADSVPPPPCDQ